MLHQLNNIITARHIYDNATKLKAVAFKIIKINMTQFFDNLAKITNLSEVFHEENHKNVPDDWFIIVCDIINSTQASASGHYKDVNLIGAACITAVLNRCQDAEVPFIFGGDGATFSVPPDLKQAAINGLNTVQALAQHHFQLGLRVSVIPASHIHDLGYELAIGKLAMSSYISQAIFIGKGWEYAEQLMKTEDGLAFQIKQPEDIVAADLSGLECRWQKINNRKGQTITVLVKASADEPLEQAKLYQMILEKIFLLYEDRDNFHPLSLNNLSLTFNLAALSGEAKIRSFHQGSFWCYLLLLFIKVFFGAYFFKFSVDTETTHWSQYKQDLLEHTDFMKFDGTLRFVIDSSPEQTNELKAYLSDLQSDQLLEYGLDIADSALMTCLVFNHEKQHIHFVDGNNGGYINAAKQLYKR